MSSVSRDYMQTTQQITLTKELVSLVHFVELNESGWVKKTLGKIILSVLHTSLRPMTFVEVSEALAAAACHEFHIEEIRDALNLLISQQKAVEHPRGVFKIRETELAAINSAIAATASEDEVTRMLFCEQIARSVPGVDGESLWPFFLDLYLLPLIRGAGASTLNLISGGGLVTSRESLQPFFAKAEASRHEELLHAVVEFLNPSVAEIRQFILKRVAAAFFVSAVSLDQKTISALDNKRKKETRLKLFLDTNTLFSILSLHENDGNSDVQGLIALNRNPAANVKLKLFVFPETIVEATAVLANAAASFGTYSYPRSLAAAGLRVNVSGVKAKYLEAASRSSVPLSPRDYFAPYIEGLNAILRARGIEIIDRSLLVARTDQEVVDDVLGMVEWENENVPADRRKGYEAIMHDVYVWHCVNRLRPQEIDSPLDAQEWFITLDRRLLGFDTYKRRNLSRSVPTCVRPSTFIQYSQFWTPRSAEFERALFGSLRLPLLFRDFDSDTEDVTMAILQKLSRFETVGDFSEDEIQTLLLNQAIRTKFGETRSEEAQQELIRDQLLQIHADTVAREQALRSKLEAEGNIQAQLQREIANSSQISADVTAQLAATREASRLKALEDEARVVDLNARLTANSELLRQAEIRIHENKEKTKFLLITVLVPLVLGLLFAIILLTWFKPWFAIAMGAAAWLCLTLCLMTMLGKANPSVLGTPWLAKITKVASYIWIPLAAMVSITVASVYQNILQEKQSLIMKEVASTVGAGLNSDSSTPAGNKDAPETKKDIKSSKDIITK